MAQSFKKLSARYWREEVSSVVSSLRIKPSPSSAEYLVVNPDGTGVNLDVDFIPDKEKFIDTVIEKVEGSLDFQQLDKIIIEKSRQATESLLRLITWCDLTSPSELSRKQQEELYSMGYFDKCEITEVQVTVTDDQIDDFREVVCDAAKNPNSLKVNSFLKLDPKEAVLIKPHFDIVHRIIFGTVVYFNKKKG